MGNYGQESRVVFGMQPNNRTLNGSRLVCFILLLTRHGYGPT